MNQAMLCGRALFQINRFNEEMEFFMNEEATYNCDSDRQKFKKGYFVPRKLYC